MEILLLGSDGFIGRRTAARLTAEGHRVCGVSRQMLDFCRPSEDAAKRLLAGRQLVINTVGIMSRDAAVLETVHHLTPAKLARWAKEAGVRRWVQLSALGADGCAAVAFAASKGRGDAAVLAAGLETAVARPSLVFGRGGRSCALFLALAGLPLLPLPDGGRAVVQPVAVGDVAEGLAKLAALPSCPPAPLAMVGAERMSLAAYLGLLRRNVLGKQSDLRTVAVSPVWLRPVLPVLSRVSGGLVGRDNLMLLAQGSYADVADFAELLGRMPLGAESFSLSD